MMSRRLLKYLSKFIDLNSLHSKQNYRHTLNSRHRLLIRRSCITWKTALTRRFYRRAPPRRTRIRYLHFLVQVSKRRSKANESRVTREKSKSKMSSDDPFEFTDAKPRNPYAEIIKTTTTTKTTHQRIQPRNYGKVKLLKLILGQVLAKNRKWRFLICITMVNLFSPATSY
jgi:hypothetical protein